MGYLVRAWYATSAWMLICNGTGSCKAQLATSFYVFRGIGVSLYLGGGREMEGSQL